MQNQNSKDNQQQANWSLALYYVVKKSSSRVGNQIDTIIKPLHVNYKI